MQDGPPVQVHWDYWEPHSHLFFAQFLLQSGGKSDCSYVGPLLLFLENSHYAEKIRSNYQMFLKSHRIIQVEKIWSQCCEVLKEGERRRCDFRLRTAHLIVGLWTQEVKVDGTCGNVLLFFTCKHLLRISSVCVDEKMSLYSCRFIVLWY